jgi:hypothetical protein
MVCTIEERVKKVINSSITLDQLEVAREFANLFKKGYFDDLIELKRREINEKIEGGLHGSKDKHQDI